MPLPRRQIVDPEITPWYHCISRCVRNSHIHDQVKAWGEQRIQELSEIFAINVGAYSILDTHLHLLLHLDIKQSKRWTKTEVLEHWARLYPPRGADRKPLTCIKSWMTEKLKDPAFVKERRKRLANLGWFMKSLKEPMAHLANELDGQRGTFWSGRFKSIAVLDELALLSTAIYIDLNPFAAGIARLPEEAAYTSLKYRLESVRFQGKLADLCVAESSGVRATLGGLESEKELWLCPIEDRRAHGGTRVGVTDRLSLGSYLLLLDATGRLHRAGKQHLADHVHGILHRQMCSNKRWQRHFEMLRSGDRLVGTYYAFSRAKLNEAAEHRGCRHVANLNGCPAQ